MLTLRDNVFSFLMIYIQAQNNTINHVNEYNLSNQDLS